MISPDVGVYNKLKHLNSVDLPLPEEPIITTHSPSLTFKEISLRTGFPLKDLDKFLTFKTDILSTCLSEVKERKFNLFAVHFIFE